MNDVLCIHATISGKVQGVFFRATTVEQAKKLALTGWVKNLNNGDVELIACGKRNAIMKLTDWLWQGPPQAQVANVTWQECPLEKFNDFIIF